MAVKKSRKRSGFVIYSYSKVRQPHLTPGKRDVKFQSKYVKEVPFVNRRYTKGEPFQS